MAAVCVTSGAAGLPLTHTATAAAQPQPINVLYGHLHNSIRAELDTLSSWVTCLEPDKEQQLLERLLDLKQRYHFLEQVYKYHSSVEDEVVYPALESKIRNVTLAYSVEHQDEEVLFEQLAQLLNSALGQLGEERRSTVRSLICKIEEIHTTLRKHLSKEEQQLLPLLLQHFSAAEQAELVAQFLYCIPLATVERVVSWLKPQVPQAEMQGLLKHLRCVIPDALLLQLLVAWLNHSPGQAAGEIGAAASSQAAGSAADGAAARDAQPADGTAAVPASGSKDGGSRWPPLNSIVLFHQSIRGALQAFVGEAVALQGRGDVSGAQLASLVERHRFLRSVCMFHTLSEEEVMFPEAARLSGGAAGAAAIAAACSRCQQEHQDELTLFEELGRLLADVRSLARRGRKEVGAMLGQLVESARGVCAAISAHMQREEADVLPALARHLDDAEQRVIVWRTLRAMPLRLLERVMPWLVATLSAEDAEEMLGNVRLGAPAADTALVELLLRWADRGRGAAAAAAALVATQQRADGVARVADVDPGLYANDTCELRLVGCGVAGQSGTDAAEPPAKRVRLDSAQASRGGSPGSSSPASSTVAVGAQPASTADGIVHTMALPAMGGMGATPAGAPAASSPAGGGYNPIDHIFQFHKALKQELKQLNLDAAALEAAALTGSTGASSPTAVAAPTAVTAEVSPISGNAGASGALGQAAAAEGQGSDTAIAATAPATSSAFGPVATHETDAAIMREAFIALQQLDGRFQFLWGIYRAHSKAEDEIVFPALESKEALHNVSHAYTLDHAQEEQLFLDLADTIAAIKRSTSLAQVRTLSLQLRRMCAAVRASLETHVRAEEAELWPLFAEHFTLEEQQALVGVIIGRTGAEVLQAMLPWAISSFSEEERDAMMSSFREATKNTMFDQWLDAVQQGGASGARSPAAEDGAAAAAAAATAGSDAGGFGALGYSAQQLAVAPLADIVEYLTSTQPEVAQHLAPAGHLPPEQQPEASGAVSESSLFRPGWEEIFNLNQKQLEAAIRRVSTDPALEPERKAYLIQNMMVSRYIVAQQRRMQSLGSTPSASIDTPGGSLSQGPGAAGSGHVCGAADGHVHGPGCSHSYSHQHMPSCSHSHGHAHFHPTSTISAAATAPAGPAALAPAQQQQHPNPHLQYHDAAAGVLGCRHYKRRARLVAPCCGKAFTCRLCHDEASDHKMDRYAVSQMVCMHCGLQQPVAGTCSGCEQVLASYYCSICHLFDDEAGRDIYHCPFCNVCRRGKGLGVDFFHCMQCNACMSLSLFSSHTCRERAMEGNCPVCHENLFTSSAPIKELPCGHFLHSSCFASYCRYNYTCPICCKSIGDMSVYFQMLDSLLAAEWSRLPPELATRMQPILCQDCGRSGEARYHYVYHACPHCRSYNTRVL